MGIIDRAKTAFTRFAGPPDTADAPKTVESAEADVTNAEYEAEHAARALGRATDDLTAAVGAANAAETAYVADPSAINDAAVASTAHASKLAGLRVRAAEQKLQAANDVLEGARAALDEARTAVTRAELTERSDLDAFKARQAERSAAILECLEKMRALARESDEDFAETNRASEALGIAPLDIVHLVGDIAESAAPFTNHDDTMYLRNEQVAYRFGRPSLEATLLGSTETLAIRNYKFRNDETFSFSTLRQYRTNSEYLAAQAAAKAAREQAAKADAPRNTEPAPNSRRHVVPLNIDRRVDDESPDAQRAPDIGTEWW